jgi:hypothetical protein
VATVSDVHHLKLGSAGGVELLVAAGTAVRLGAAVPGRRRLAMSPSGSAPSPPSATDITRLSGRRPRWHAWWCSWSFSESGKRMWNGIAFYGELTYRLSSKQRQAVAAGGCEWDPRGQRCGFGLILRALQRGHADKFVQGPRII